MWFYYNYKKTRAIAAFFLDAFTKNAAIANLQPRFLEMRLKPQAIAAFFKNASIANLKMQLKVCYSRVF